MPNYDLGRVFRLDFEELTYIGSSTEKTLAQRLATLVRDFKQGKQGLLRLLFARGTPVITLVEAYPCKSRDELRMRERYWIDKLECINKMKMEVKPRMKVPKKPNLVNFVVIPQEVSSKRNYELGKIYRMDCEELTYIGSTCLKSLSLRLAKHAYDFKSGSNISSKELFVRGKPVITLVEACSCKSKEELLIRERYWYDRIVSKKNE